MKIVCAFCGKVNPGGAETCAQCGSGLATAFRVRRKIPWASWAPAIPVAALLFLQVQNFQRAQAEANARQQKLVEAHREYVRSVRAEHQAMEADLEAKHRALLNDARLISGAKAAERHADEWKRRQNHDPKLARTVLEKMLLEVERLGKDPSLTAEAALEKVANLVTPPRSRIEVTHGDHGSIVRVAFRLSAVRPQEAGGATHHQSTAEMRTEIEEVTAKVIKDLFDYCGARGIQRLSVSCNRAILIGKGENQRLVMRSLYRASVESEAAAQVASWRIMSAGAVANLMAVEHDVVSGIMITKNTGRRFEEDPNEPLEF
ncbi:MAG TPA: hypothetical protein VM680_08340 [Verrucomicrobiae bacterium]|nr:hypothetical protein [Verrucomicrobiae bacterium]